MAAFKICLLALMLAAVTVNADLSTDVNKFDGRFYEAVLQKTKGENSIISSLSAEILLSMVLEGAGGTTEAELRKALILEDTKAVPPAVKDLMTNLNEAKDVELKLANAIYVGLLPSAKTDMVKPAYQTVVRDSFMSEITQVNFAENVEAAALMNKWVEDRTNHHIKDLVNANDLNALTKAVLINAVYFKGNWLKPFSENNTAKYNFTRADGSSVAIDLMSQDGTFLYKKSPALNSQILILPYKNENLRLVVILPDKVNGLPELEKKLGSGSNQYLQDLQEQDMTVIIPKFKIETTIRNLKDVLHTLGIKEIFTPHANLERMFDDSAIHFTNAIQKAFIEVNERGSEAAAATDVVGPSATPNHVFFQADHGFYFAIQYKDITIFSGSFRSG